MASPEKEFTIETEILEWLNCQKGVFAFKVETGGYYDKKKGFFRKRKSKFNIKGTPDIIGIKSGKFFAIECKSLKGQITSHQERFLNHVILMGGKAAVCRSISEANQFLSTV